MKKIYRIFSLAVLATASALILSSCRPDEPKLPYHSWHINGVADPLHDIPVLLYYMSADKVNNGPCDDYHLKRAGESYSIEEVVLLTKETGSVDSLYLVTTIDLEQQKKVEAKFYTPEGKSFYTWQAILVWQKDYLPEFPDEEYSVLDRNLIYINPIVPDEVQNQKP